MERKDIKLVLANLGQRKLLSSTLVLLTLAIGIVIGTLISGGVDAARTQREHRTPNCSRFQKPFRSGTSFRRLPSKSGPRSSTFKSSFGSSRGSSPSAVHGPMKGTPRTSSGGFSACRKALSATGPFRLSEGADRAKDRA